MSKIFEEALADVKKLKEVAEENAKNAIIESVTPKIREYVEKKIFEQSDAEEMSEDNESDEDVVLDTEEIKELASMLESKNITNASLFKAYESLDREKKKKINIIANKINENNKTLSSKKINNNENIQNRNVDMSEKFYEIDLKLLREAVNDAEEVDKLAEKFAEKEEMSMMYEAEDEEVSVDDDDSSEEMSDDGMGMDMDMDMGLGAPAEDDSMLARDDVEAAISDLIADLGIEIDSGMDMDDDSEEAIAEMMQYEEDEASEGDLCEDSEDDDDKKENLEEVFDVDPRMLRQEIAKVKSMLSEGKVDHHFGGKASGTPGVKGAFGGTGPKKHGYQKSFGGGSYGKDVFVTPPSTLKKLNEARKMLQKLSRQNRAQNEKLNKYRSAVHTLREQLEDLNLFNAKLLYVNKLLQNKGLNQSQKRSVIKALDEARSLGETKALYKSLTSSLRDDNTSNKMLSESIRRGSSSRSTKSSAPAGNLNEGADIGRWQKLAGLK